MPITKKRSLVGFSAIALLSACANTSDETETDFLGTSSQKLEETSFFASNCTRDNEPSSDKITPPIPTYKDWPHVRSAIKKDARQETWISKVVKGMSLAQKVGQMTQPESLNLTPDDVRRYYIGSVLSGGNDWPATKEASPADWLSVVDSYWEASMSTDMPVQIPLIYGVDALHGNQKQMGATLFPHNIGLGAANDPDLAKRIGEATAQQMRVSGFDYTFAPCVTVPQDDRWGRSYEGYSEYPGITRTLGAAVTEGLMDIQRGNRSFRGVITTAKHFLGDGSTNGGEDQGVSTVDEQTLINIHGQGYFASIAAGAQTVMASYNSWNSPDGVHEGKIHGNKYLLTTVLKEKIGFDGFIISDYNGHGQIPGCTNTRCAQAINAGIDMFMVPYKPDWQNFIADTIDLVNKGEVPMSRIDDAVTRILRVKVRAGLFSLPKPSLRKDAGNESKMVNVDLAREAVSKSLVLLKNNHQVLPMSRRSRVLLVGKSGDSLRNQVGGWSLGWQNFPPFDANTNASFSGQTIFQALKDVVGASNVTFNEMADGVNVNDYDVVIAAIGETPYAEFIGDIKWNSRYNWGPTGGVIPDGYAAKQTLENAVRNPEDLAVLDKVSGHGVPVVSVFISGRPLYTNKELNRSDAFVAAWLPGSEARGIVDMLFLDKRNRHEIDFQGKLSFSWPKSACQTSLNVGQPNYDPLFPYGYGLTYGKRGRNLPKLPEISGPATGCPN
jgi:beta-glucosidase